jgi:hypothetical protein
MIATIKPHSKTAVIAVKDKVEDSPWTEPRNNAEAADYVPSRTIPCTTIPVRLVHDGLSRVSTYLRNKMPLARFRG